MTALGLGVMIVLVALIILFFLVMFVMSAYHRLVALRNRCKHTYAQMDVQLKRRYDLISGLIDTANGCIKQEHETLENVARARNIACAAAQTAAANPGDSTAMKNLATAEASLARTLAHLLSERYPELKSNQRIIQLSEELTSIETGISSARQTYNGAVTNYNSQREIFPANFIASVLKFAPAEPFVVEEKEKLIP